MKLVYPAIFYTDEVSEGYTVEVPDLPGCVTKGNTLEEAVENFLDAASGWVLDELEDGRVAPIPSSPLNMNLDEGSFVRLLTLAVDSFTDI